MRLVTVEEHFATPEVIGAWAAQQPPDQEGTSDIYRTSFAAPLLDLGEGRLAWMDGMGVDTQVLSLTQPGVQTLEPELAVELARQANDRIADAIRQAPDRFQGLATLPTPDPEAAAAELRRSVRDLALRGAITFGRTGDRHLDHPDNDPIFAAADELRVPLFIHPQFPQRAVREALYSGLPGRLSFAISSAGLGWHYEAGVEFVRLALAGVLDRYPDLRIILGHWGDTVAFYLDEIDIIPKLLGGAGYVRPMSDYVARHLYVGVSGTLSHRYLGWATEVLGSDRVLLSLDYPFVSRAPGEATDYVASAPVSQIDREKLAWRNWEALTERVRVY
jgi:predicted TIM-barrel fold metal-dependent hydrolase